jgi:CheY-like chemotaxis protein
VLAPEPGLRVLIVDDNEDVIEVLVDGLESYGHTVRSASTKADALRLVTEFRPAVAIIDIALVGTDGWELAGEIQALGLPDSPRLLALTGFTDDVDRERSMQAGFERHLLKPVRMPKLDAIVRGRE